MKDIALNLAPFDEDARSACLAQAIELGFSKFDLWNFNDAMADAVVDAFAGLDGPRIRAAGLTRPDVDAIILAAARYDGCDEHEDKEGFALLERGIRLLPTLVPLTSPATLSDLGKLMVLFAAYTCSTPAERTSEEWKSELDQAGRTLSDEAAKLVSEPRDTAAIDQALDFIIANFGALWD